MNVANAIETRRSIKALDPAHRMSVPEQHDLFRLAMLSPTAFNIQNWRFVVVEDLALRRDIRQAAWDQAQVTDSSLLVVLCADLKAWGKKPRNATGAMRTQGCGIIWCPLSSNITAGAIR